MASRVYLELPLQEQRKINQTKPKHRSSSKPDTKNSKIYSTTPRASEINSPQKQVRKFFEIRRISYQTICSRKKRTELPFVFPRVLSNKTNRNLSISPGKLTIRTMNSTKTQFLEELEQVPMTVSKTYYNERLVWRKRKDRMMPLGIINFNGVVGDYCRGESENKFELVEGAKFGIKLLTGEFFVVLVSWYTREITKQLIKFLEDEEIDYDALYIVRHRKLKYRFRHNYSQILEDFQIKDSFNQTLLITSLVINREEMAERRGADLFYEETLSGCNRFTSIGLPPVCDDVPTFPLCVLVPHFGSSEEIISLMDLARFVLGVKNKCDGQLAYAEFDGEVNLPCEHMELPVIPKRPNTKSGLRYILYTFCRIRKNRLSKSRKSSKFK